MPVPETPVQKRSWTAEDDLELVQVVRSVRPWKSGHGSKISAWEEITSQLSGRKVQWRTVQNRFEDLMDWKSKGNQAKRRATGGNVEVPPSVVDIELEECLALMKSDSTEAVHSSGLKKTSSTESVTGTGSTAKDQDVDAVKPDAAPRKRTKKDSSHDHMAVHHASIAELIAVQTQLAVEKLKEAEIERRGKELQVEKMSLELEELKKKLAEK